MSAPAPRVGAPGLATAPGPEDFVATVTPAPAATWQEAQDAAADAGVLVAGRERAVGGLGVAATLTLPHGLEDAAALDALVAWLARVECRRRGGALAGGPGFVVALGAFPFDRAARTSLVVPSTAWCREPDGQVWRVEVRRRDGRPPDKTPAEAASSASSASSAPSAPWRGRVVDGPAGAGDRPSLHLVPSGARYAEAVAHAVRRIRAGALAKVVLGRMVELELPVPVAASALLRELQGEEEGTSARGLSSPFSPFSVPTPFGRLVGASPELIIARRGSAVVSHAFAGTVPLSATDGEADERRLAESAKDRAEHRLVVDEIVAALEPRCVSLTVPDAPSVVRLRSDARLGTLIRATLDAPASPDAPRGAQRQGAGAPDSVLGLLARLHPTPAVGGVPRAVALEEIAALEPAPRGYWAGVAGWVDGAGDGEWVLAIRSAELDGRRARVRAGAGIVSGSEPARELAETTVKLRPVLEALWPGVSSRL